MSSNNTDETLIKYLVTIESSKTKEEIAEKLGVKVESIYTFEEFDDAHILNPNQAIM